MSNYLQKVIRTSEGAVERPVVWRMGLGALVVGGVLVLCGLAWWLVPQLSFGSDGGEPTASPVETRIVCSPNEFTVLLQPLIEEWNRLPQQSDWRLQSDINSSCQATISTTASPSTLPWYSFPLVLLYPRSANVSSITAVQWQELKTTKGALNLTQWPMSEFVSSPPDKAESLAQEGKRFIATPQQAIDLMHLMQPVSIDGKSIQDNEYLLKVTLLWSSSKNDPQTTALQNYLSSELIRTGSGGQVSTMVLSGPQQLGARSQFTKQPSLSARVRTAIGKANLFLIANQTTLTDRCSQRPTSAYLCGRPSSLASYQPALKGVFIYGNSSLDYDYNDFVSMVQRLQKQQVEVVGADLKDHTPLAAFSSPSGTIYSTGFNLGTKPETCAGSKPGLPAGLVCVGTVASASQRLQRANLQGPTIVWLYKPTQFSTNEINLLLKDNPRVLIVVTISPQQSRTGTTWQRSGQSVFILSPRWKFDAESPDFFEITLFNNQLWSVQQL